MIPGEVPGLPQLNYLSNSIPIGHKGFGHAVSLSSGKAVIYMVEKIEAVSYYISRQFIHVHAIEVDLADYVNSNMTPLDFKEIFIDYGQFTKLYSSNVHNFLSSLPTEYKHSLLAESADVFTGRDEVENLAIYTDGISIFIFYNPNAPLDNTIRRLFREVKELYFYNFVLGYEVQQRELYVVMLPDNYKSMVWYTLSNMKHIQLDSLKNILREKISRECSNVIGKLSTRLNGLEHVNDEDKALEEIKSVRKEIDWLKSSLGVTQYLDDHGKANLSTIESRIDCLLKFSLYQQENICLDEWILRYPFVKNKMRKLLQNLVNRVLKNEIKNEDISLLKKLRSWEPSLYEHFLELFYGSMRSSSRETLFSFLKALVDQNELELGGDVFIRIYATNSGDNKIDELIDSIDSLKLIDFAMRLFPSFRLKLEHYESKIQEVRRAYEEEKMKIEMEYKRKLQEIEIETKKKTRNILKKMLKEINDLKSKRGFI